ncbi:MAG: helix-turn-helix transcriptional regulator [Clostridiales bacterium]|nr:helix-turn-helix transcriptional regulator [Clostridiales bacterium]
MKNELNSLVIIKEYGFVKVKLAEMLDERGITRNKLSTLIGVKYDVINRYYKAENITMVDIDLFARICYVLDCNITDLLEYVKNRD